MLSVFQKVALPALFLFTANAAFAESLPEARSKFETKIVQQVEDDGFRFPTPPSNLFSIVQYESQVGALSAMLSKPVDPKKKYPAIIWLTGGFPVGGIGESAWMPKSKSNDQSAKAYREAGIIMMYPSLRGTMGNPGQQEGFYGEVDDVISALHYLQKQPFGTLKRRTVVYLHQCNWTFPSGWKTHQTKPLGRRYYRLSNAFSD
jgi:hypothetical protein